MPSLLVIGVGNVLQERFHVEAGVPRFVYHCVNAFHALLEGLVQAYWYANHIRFLMSSGFTGPGPSDPIESSTRRARRGA